MAATVIITPAYLGAAPAARSVDVRADSPQHQRTIELIGRLISGSEAVLGVHERSQSPLAEVTLWLEDAVNPGTVDECEIAVLSHSRALQTVTLYMLPEQEESEAVEDSSDPARAFRERPVPLGEVFRNIRVEEPQEQVQEPFDLSDMHRADFCRRWRERTDLRRRLLATGVSDLTFAVPGSSAGKQLLRISLTWPSDSSDSTDRASLVLDVPTRGRP